MSMKSLKLIALLLDYPERDLWDDSDELLKAINECDELQPQHNALLNDFTQQMSSFPLLNIQADYGDLFDRGRSLSLLLFEHVHGESRDRGQAMIDLIDQYALSGMVLSTNQLPDYLPTYLEYLSQLEKKEAIQGLKDIVPILALLKERLHQRGSLYSDLFEILVDLSGEVILQQTLAERVSQETKDDTPQALDAVWEEEQIKFSGEASCASEQQIQHQRRFAQVVVPQYLDINEFNGAQS